MSDAPATVDLEKEMIRSFWCSMVDATASGACFCSATLLKIRFLSTMITDNHIRREGACQALYASFFQIPSSSPLTRPIAGVYYIRNRAWIIKTITGERSTSKGQLCPDHVLFQTAPRFILGRRRKMGENIRFNEWKEGGAMDWFIKGCSGVCICLVCLLAISCGGGGAPQKQVPIGVTPVSNLIYDSTGLGSTEVGISGVEMTNGDIIAAWQSWSGDINTAVAKASVSSDGGKTWGIPYVLIDDPLRITSPVFIVADDVLFLFYGASDWDNPDRPSALYCKTSTDNAQTWGSPVEIDSSNTLLMISSNPIQLSTGRIVLPVLYADATYHHAGTVYYSDDNGVSWQRGGNISSTSEGFSGQTIVELSDGSIYMMIRNFPKGMWQWESCSYDEGINWIEAVATDIQSPSSIARIFKTSDGVIVLAWNNVQYASGAVRTPLTVAYSFDDAASWTVAFNVADDPDGRYSNHGLLEKSNGEMVLLYSDETDYLNKNYKLYSAIFVVDVSD